MELQSAIYNRRTIRAFTKKTVDENLIITIIRSGMQAPTACNVQGWKFIIVYEPQLKKWLVDSGVPMFINDSPVGIIVAYDNRTSNHEYKDNIQSGGAVIQNMLLTAHSLGIGSCWICRLPSQDTMRKMFNIPNEFDIIAYVALGYPKQVPEVKRKYSYEDAVSYNTFKGKISKESIKRRVYLMIPKPLKLFYRLCMERLYRG